MSRTTKAYKKIAQWSLVWIVLGSGLTVLLIWGLLSGWFGVRIKSGELGGYGYLVWSLLASIPIAVFTLYISAHLERQEGEAPYFVPGGVLRLWTTLIILLIFVWSVSPFFDGQYRLYRQVLRGLSWPLVLAYIIGTVLLWFVPQHKSWSKGVIRWMIILMCFGAIAGGIYAQQDMIAWHLNNREKLNQQSQRPLRTVTVTFRENFTTEEWERFIERLDWSLYGYYVEKGEITVIQCNTKDVLAMIDTSTNLVKIRESFVQQRPDTEWFGACIQEMKVTGTVQNEFERSLSQYRLEVGIGAEVIDIDWADPEVEE